MFLFAAQPKLRLMSTVAAKVKECDKPKTGNFGPASWGGKNQSYFTKAASRQMALGPSASYGKGGVGISNNWQYRRLVDGFRVISTGSHKPTTSFS
jgi:hypothetical protein